MTENKETYLSYDFINVLSATIKLMRQKEIDLKLQYINNTSDILEFYTGLDEVIFSKKRYEELVADAIAFKEIIELYQNPNDKNALCKNVIAIAESVLYGITILRLLSFTDILQLSKNVDSFDNSYEYHKKNYNARIIHLSYLATYYITFFGEGLDDFLTNAHLDKLHDISASNYQITIAIETKYNQEFKNGYFSNILNNEILINYRSIVSNEELFKYCAKLLGWGQFFNNFS